MQIIRKDTYQEKQKTQQQIQKQIPQGSCYCRQIQKLQSVKFILRFPLYQNLCLLNESKFFQCVIIKKLVQGQQPIYHLIYQNQKKRLLSAQKQPNNIGCNYLISKSQKPKKDQNFVGKLRGNFRNTQFFIYDGGDKIKLNNNKKRKQLGFIQYIQQSIFDNHSKKIQVLIPQPVQTTKLNNQHLFYQPYELILNQKQNILKEYSSNQPQLVLKLKNQIDKLNKKTNEAILQLNLLNIISKNKTIDLKMYYQEFNKFQQALIFNYRSQNTFNLSIGWPLNIIQGFAIVLSLIQRSLK